MIRVHKKTECTGCNACSSICPQKCIYMKADEEGFLYPVTDTDKCVNCGLCEKVCPIIFKQQSNEPYCTNAISANNKEKSIRNCSSSGGVFTVLAKNIIRQSGVVFGAAFNESFKKVEHICVDNETDLRKLRGSKYVQSWIGDSYCLAKDYLDSGRIVLFSGTPCQIAGLHSFLGKTYNNLFTQDIICHGVPSPLVWEKYVDLREAEAASKTLFVDFRNKKYGWRTYSVRFDFANGKKYIKPYIEDSFMRAYLSNLCLRPSCHNCHYKSIHRQADLTLADFWGIQNYYPEMDDDDGTSLVLVHSKRGDQLLEWSSDQLINKPIDVNVVEKYNPAAICSSTCSKYRHEFLTTISSGNFDVFVDHHYPIIFKDRIKVFMARTGLLKIVFRIKRLF